MPSSCTEGPAEILAHDAQCLARQQQGIENLPGFAVEEDRVACLAR